MSQDANTHFTGMRGVYAAATELSRRKYVVTVTSANAQAVDLLVFGPEGQVAIGVEVKSSASPKWEKDWPVSSRLLASDSYFYVFVRFEDEVRPPTTDFYVVPSAEVAKRLRRVKSPYIRLEDITEFKNAWTRLPQPKSRHPEGGGPSSLGLPDE